jgi:hypothetical protein
MFLPEPCRGLFTGKAEINTQVQISCIGDQLLITGEIILAFSRFIYPPVLLEFDEVEPVILQDLHVVFELRHRRHGFTAEMGTYRENF